MSGWQRAEWETRVQAAGLPSGTVVTALALGRLAGADGIAAPGLAGLAAESGCSVDTAHRRLCCLESRGFAVRRGRVSGVLPRRAVIRWQLAVPVGGGGAGLG